SSNHPLEHLRLLRLLCNDSEERWSRSQLVLRVLPRENLLATQFVHLPVTVMLLSCVIPPLTVRKLQRVSHRSQSSTVVMAVSSTQRRRSSTYTLFEKNLGRSTV